VLACANTFPGHGDTSSDSHLELPVLATTAKRLEALGAAPPSPKQAIAAGVASVMTRPPATAALDPQRPATLSSAVLISCCARTSASLGLVVTDAPGDGAIAGQWALAKRPVLAFAAARPCCDARRPPMPASKPCSKPLQSGRNPLGPGSSRAWSGASAHSPLRRAAPGPGDATCPLGDPRRAESNAERALARELATLEACRLKGVASYYRAGPGLKPESARQQAVANRLPAADGTGPASGPTGFGYEGPG